MSCKSVWLLMMRCICQNQGQPMVRLTVYQSCALKFRQCAEYTGQGDKIALTRDSIRQAGPISQCITDTEFGLYFLVLLKETDRQQPAPRAPPSLACCLALRAAPASTSTTHLFSLLNTGLLLTALPLFQASVACQLHTRSLPLFTQTSLIIPARCKACVYVRSRSPENSCNMMSRASRHCTPLPASLEKNVLRQMALEATRSSRSVVIWGLALCQLSVSLCA